MGFRAGSLHSSHELQPTTLMKSRFILPCLILSATAAMADLTIEQKLENGKATGSVILKIKGDRFRSDMPNSPIGSMSTIVNTKTMDTITLMHARKTAMRIDGAKLLSMRDAMGKKESERPKLVDTGKSEKVGEYDAEIFTWTNGNVSQTLWVAKNFPDFDKLKEDIEKVHKAGPRGSGMINSVPDMSSLPGMVVKTQTTAGPIKMVNTLVSVKHGDIDDSEFYIPKDYKLSDQPVPPASLRPKKNVE